MPPDASPARYHALDALRGAMMLLGIYLHAAVAYAPAGGWPWKQAELTTLLHPSMAVIHIFRMPIFYAMAGFFAALLVARRGARAMAANRVRRILLPFLLGWAVIFPLVVLLVGSARSGWRATLDLFASGKVLGYAHPLHLWFLEYLLLLYLFAGLAVPGFQALPEGWRSAARRGFRIVVGAWWGPLALALPSCLALLPMPRAELLEPPGFMPVWFILAAYAVPFFFGWALHAEADLLEPMRRRAYAWLALAGIACLLYLGVVPYPADPGLRFYLLRVEHSVALWLLIFGVTGLFLRLCSGYAAWRRYLCDASYFLYLAHMPALLAMQMLLAPLPWPPLAKAAVALAGTVAVLLAAYHLIVRDGAIGAFLNGPRRPAPLPAE